MTSLSNFRPDANANTFFEKLWGGGIVQWAGLLHWAGVLQGPRRGQQTGTNSEENKEKGWGNQQPTGVRWLAAVVRCHHQSCHYQSLQLYLDLWWTETSHLHIAYMLIDPGAFVVITCASLLCFQSGVRKCTFSLCSWPQMLLFSLVSSQRWA